MNWQKIQAARGEVLVVCSTLTLDEFKAVVDQLGMDIYHAGKADEKRTEAEKAEA